MNATFRGLALPLLLVLGGCASGGSNPSSMAATSPIVSVERFLQAAHTEDLAAMAQIFGNRDGPIAGQTGSTFGCAFKRMGSWIGVSDRCRQWTDIDLRMNALAQILVHDEFAVRSESNVPGRLRPAIRVGVDLIHGNNLYSDVPFVVVQGQDGRWMVEEIGLGVITGG